MPFCRYSVPFVFRNRFGMQRAGGQAAKFDSNHHWV
jgi:hypothetical protein